MTNAFASMCVSEFEGKISIIVLFLNREYMKTSGPKSDLEHLEARVRYPWSVMTGFTESAYETEDLLNPKPSDSVWIKHVRSVAKDWIKNQNNGECPAGLRAWGFTVGLETAAAYVAMVNAACSMYDDLIRIFYNDNVDRFSMQDARLNAVKQQVKSLDLHFFEPSQIVQATSSKEVI